MKNKQLILPFLACAFMASCSLGPTAMLADGSKITLGGSVLTEAEADARQANMPNGLALNWVRTGVNETGVAKAGLGAWALGKGIGGYTKNVAAKEATKQVGAKEATKQLSITTEGELGKGVLGTAVPGQAAVTGGGVSVVPIK